VTAWGLIAGLRFNDMLNMAPGLILDLYIYRRNYDDAENGIRREEPKIYD
jgi:hypothetical protein